MALVVLHDLLDPLEVSTDLGVDTGSLGLPAFLHAPGHDALEGPVANQRSSGVTLRKDGGGGGVNPPFSTRSPNSGPVVGPRGVW